MEQLGKLQMKLLINEKEISNYLANLVDIKKYVEGIEVPEVHTSEALGYALVEREKGVNNWKKKKHKIKDKIRNGVERDLREYFRIVKTELEEKKELRRKLVHKNINKLIDKLGSEKILRNYKKSQFTGFVKSTGLNLNPNSILVRRKNYTNLQEDCLFRNMDGNENMLLEKMNNNWSFWFIDTGYTNFLHFKKKIWHRLVRNNLHHSKFIDVPSNRLTMFESFPQPWREGGDKILLIEPGGFCARTFNINIEQWKTDTINELRKYTDKKIVIREKLSKKVRKSLYKELCDEDYYCVVNINSNAAVEAVWAGIPAITLQRHISNPVTKNNLSDINNLFKGNVASWLCALSYSQFTYEELVDGTAAKIVRKYHV